MKEKSISEALRKVAWGYFFLHINFNLGSINILPGWVAYIWFAQAIPVLGDEEESVNLLEPLAVLLGIFEGIYWVNTAFFASVLPLQLIVVIESVLALYFHFQLLTNLASIAHKYGCIQEKTLLTLRTVKTILTTVIVITNTFLIVNWAIYAIVVALLLITIWLCIIITGFRVDLEEAISKIEKEQKEVMV